MHSYIEQCFDVTMCLGVVAKTGRTLSMQGGTLSHCRWGIFAGADGGRLRAGNPFLQNGSELGRRRRSATAAEAKWERCGLTSESELPLHIPYFRCRSLSAEA
eukprot:819764-Prymnesium_polylepis.2